MKNVLFAWGLFVFSATSFHSAVAADKVVVSSKYTKLDVVLAGKKLNIAKPDDLQSALKIVSTQIALSKEQESKGLKEYDAPRVITKKMRLGLEEVQKIAVRPNVTSGDLKIVQELLLGFENNFRDPAPKPTEAYLVPFALAEQNSESVGQGTTQALNIAASPGDSSLVDPEESLFWTAPKDISSHDLYNGFSRSEIPQLGNTICVYDAPKLGYGTHAGFEVNCDNVKVKLKFETRNTETVNTRFFEALGYHMEENDSANTVRVKYDRRILTEYNLRQDFRAKITLVGATIYSIPIQKYRNPMRDMQEAVLKDGSHITPEQLFDKLLLSRPTVAKSTHLDYVNAIYNEEFETKIAYLVFDNVNFQIKSKNNSLQNVGSWDWNQADHPELRELRGAGILSAWLNYYDVRFDNNRVKLVTDNGRTYLKNYISDAGGGLANIRGITSKQKSNVNLFAWTFTQGAHRDGKTQREFSLPGYTTHGKNLAFKNMTLDDARWMARKIAQLSEGQIKAAILSNHAFSSAEVKLILEKLVSRRDQMIVDLKLANEIAPLRPNGVNQTFNYDPAQDGPMQITLKNGAVVTAPSKGETVVNGMLVRPNAPM